MSTRTEDLLMQVTKNLLDEHHPLFYSMIAVIYTDEVDVNIRTHDGFGSRFEAERHIEQALRTTARVETAVERIKEQARMWLAQAEHEYVTWRKTRELERLQASLPPDRVTDAPLTGFRLGGTSKRA
jgi:hypothetical protein